MAINFENQALPYGRRIVSLRLTEEQRNVLHLRKVGESHGKPVFEDVGEVWLQEETP